MSKNRVEFNGVVFTNLVTPEFLAACHIPPQEVFRTAAELNEFSQPIWESGTDFFERNSDIIRGALALLHGRAPK